MPIGRRAARAGIYAEQRYQRGLERWRRRTRPLFAAMFGPLIVGGLVILMVDRQWLSWFAGAVFGFCVGVWMWVRDSPPRYVEQWHDGAEGERKTEKALRPLEKAGWTIVHDIQEVRFGNHDHVAVGPSGVYLLESKNQQGIVDIRGGSPHLSRRHDPDASTVFRQYRPRALSAAAHIKEQIQEHCGRSTWVQAVVVFWSEFPEELVEDDRCIYIHGSGLKAWLGERPELLNEEQVEDIATVVEGLGEERVAELSGGIPAYQEN
jgi:nuclease-like protein